MWPISLTAFQFSTSKNCNVEATIPAAGIAAVRVFFSNLSLAVFAFLIANMGVIAAGVLS